jgi:6-phosphogluconolactonase
MTDRSLPVEILENAAAVSQHAAAFIAEHLRNAVAERGRATFAVSGGRTPAPTLRLLAREELAWERLDVFQVDERVLPEGHEDRNATTIRSAFSTQVALFPERFHWMPVEQPDQAVAAPDYERALWAAAGQPAVIDLVHLGLGEDGHTASIFPGAAVADQPLDVSTTDLHAGWRRMTLTMAAINRARFIVWIITGGAKRLALARLLAGDPTLVASRVRRTNVAILADSAAAGG